MLLDVKRALFPQDLDVVLNIYEEYVNSTTVSLDFQDNEEEFSNLQVKYSGDGKGIFLARMGDSVVGCAAFRKVNETVCEMKRVYVRPSSRGNNIGAMLVERILSEAQESGYVRICLDVLPEFGTALKLYESYGFTSANPITFNPVPGTKFLGLDLSQNS